MFVTLSVSNTSRARSCRLARATSSSVSPSLRTPIDARERGRLERRERDAFHRGQRHAVEKRLAPSPASDPPTDDARPRSTSAGVEPRLALRRNAAKARPEIHALGAGQRRVEHEHREEIRRRSPPARATRASDTPSCPRARGATRRSPICAGSAERRARRRRARRCLPKCSSARRSTSSGSTSPTTTSVALLGNVVPPVVAVEIVAAHRPQIVDPADRGMAIRVRAERRRRDLGVEQLLGIVLATLQLRDDDGPLRLALVRLVQPVRHALGFDEQQRVERGSCPPSRDTSSGRSRCSRSTSRRIVRRCPSSRRAGCWSVPLKFMCSTQWETPVWPGCSSPEPTRYQHHTETSGAVWTSWTRIWRPLSRRADRMAGRASGSDTAMDQLYRPDFRSFFA